MCQHFHDKCVEGAHWLKNMHVKYREFEILGGGDSNHSVLP